MKEYHEWCNRERAYAKTATVEVNEFKDQDSMALKRFEKYFGTMSLILSRSLGKMRARRKNMERRTRRAGVINQRYVLDEIVRAHAGREPTQKIYDRKHNPDRVREKLNIAMGLLLDQSGSTRFHADEDFRRIDLIKYATLTIGRSLAGLDDGFFMYAFHSHETSNPTIMEKLKSEDEPWSRTIEERIAALEHTASGRWFNNKDGAAIRFANEQILKSPMHNRYIFMVTDGNPNCDYTYYKESTAQEDTRRAMEEGNQQGIKYVYLTINKDSDAESFMELINPHTVFCKRYRKMKDIVEGLTVAYEKIKRSRR